MTDEKVIELFAEKFQYDEFPEDMEEEVKQFILTTLKQYKEELVKEIQLEKTSRRYTGHDRELYCSGLNKAIEIIKNK